MEVAVIPIKKIKVSNTQPRQEFNEASLLQLADSIKEVGQLQPVIVKRDGSQYLLIAGERRLRAIQKNQIEEIAAVILEEELDEATLRQIQLVENLQREDLNPLERARSIKSFIEENGLSKKEASKRLGIPRTTLTEWLNILEVPVEYQQEVIAEDSPLSLSHISLAKALASRTGDPTKIKELLDAVLKYKLSRSETKAVIELFHKYLHLSMDEALAAVLLRREHYKVLNNYQERLKEQKGSDSNPVRDLLKAFTHVSHKLEEIMEKVGNLGDEEKEDLLDEFLYIYQLIKIMVPELKNEELNKLLAQIKK